MIFCKNEKVFFQNLFEKISQILGICTVAIFDFRYGEIRNYRSILTDNNPLSDNIFFYYFFRKGYNLISLKI